ncbi:MAG: EamA-like transporter family protein [Candidatus Methanofastidiosum methylothiophilum]|uniref:EamA-like transporter family protein n=1 Tax=Candidatus Methanofastidiosum methylothiophilum TaxID=1705564 RepID=A0A150JAP3_9EURY|nr:MAG: EamA-like transporter family protein [Candidatus Methanofastidiosum methylthiophilus]NMC77218.1 EamA family transporter [Candidatus Methanofastidiosa archaeon]
MEKDYWAIIISAIIFGLIIPGGQFFFNLGFSLYEVSTYSLLFIFVLTIPFLLFKRSIPFTKSNIVFYLVYGLIGALLQLTQFGGMIFGTPVAIVAILIYTQPIWTTIFGKIFLNEKITKNKTIAVLIAFLGTFIIISPWKITNIGNITGTILALFAGIFLSLWVILARKTAINKEHYINTLSAYSLFSLLWLLAFFPILNRLIENYLVIRLSFDFPRIYLVYFLIFSFIAAFLPNSLFYKGIKKVEASEAGIILLLEPVVASIIGFLIFSQYLNSAIFFGGGLIIISNYLAIKDR